VELGAEGLEELLEARPQIGRALGMDGLVSLLARWLEAEIAESKLLLPRRPPMPPRDPSGAARAPAPVIWAPPGVYAYSVEPDPDGGYPRAQDLAPYVEVAPLARESPDDSRDLPVQFVCCVYGARADGRESAKEGRKGLELLLSLIERRLLEEVTVRDAATLARGKGGHYSVSIEYADGNFAPYHFGGVTCAWRGEPIARKDFYGEIKGYGAPGGRFRGLKG